MSVKTVQLHLEAFLAAAWASGWTRMESAMIEILTVAVTSRMLASSNAREKMPIDSIAWAIALAAIGAVPIFWLMLNVNRAAQQRSWSVQLRHTMAGPRNPPALSTGATPSRCSSSGTTRTWRDDRSSSSRAATPCQCRTLVTHADSSLFHGL